MIYNHILSRNLNPSLYPNITIDTESNTVTFPLFSLNDHRMVGYQQYNPNGDKNLRRNPSLGRYYTYLSEPTVWGLESVEMYDSNYLIVCEGIFKACRFHNYSIPAIATLTNNPKFLLPFLSTYKGTVIVVPDPDEAGMKLTNYSPNIIIPNKSIDQMLDSEFANFLAENKLI